MKPRLTNRRARHAIFVAAGLLSLGIWLFMAAAELCNPLHAWLHGGAVPNHDDHCAIVAIAHGKIESAPAAPVVTSAIVWVVAAPRVELHNFSRSTPALPDGRAPPVLLLPS